MSKRTTRVYTRSRNGVTRFYLDLRSLGGTQEALVAPGDRSATTDPDIAAHLAAKRVEEFREEKRRESTESQELKRREVIDGLRGRWGLKAYAVHHLKEKAKAGRTVELWLEQLQKKLQTAAEFFGDTRDVASIGVRDVQDYLAHLKTLPNGRGATLSPGLGASLPQRTLGAVRTRPVRVCSRARVQPCGGAFGQAGGAAPRSEVAGG